MFLRRSGMQDQDLAFKFAALKPHLRDIYEQGLRLTNELRGEGC